MKKKIKKINSAILIIGNEILSGRTQDKNVNFISTKKRLYLFINSPDINLFSKFIYIYNFYGEKNKKNKCCNFDHWE